MVFVDETFRVDLVDVLGAGGAGGEPAVLGDDFEAADGGVVSGGAGEGFEDGLAGEGVGLEILGGEAGEFFAHGGVGGGVFASVAGGTLFGGEFGVVFAGVFAGDGGDFSGEEAEEEAVFVGGPGGAVFAEEGGSGAFLPAEAVGAVAEAGDKPLETDGHFGEAAAQTGGDAVDHGTGDKGFTNFGVGGPLRPVGEKVLNGDGQVVVGVHEPAGAGDNAMAVRVGVGPEGEIVVVFEIDESGHGPGTAAVHADFSVPVDVHEAERGVPGGVDVGEVELIAFGDGGPVVEGGATEGIDGEFEAGVGDRVEVENVREVLDVGGEEIGFDEQALFAGLGEADAVDVLEIGFQNGVGAVLNPGGGVAVGGTAVGRVVFEAAVLRGIVGRGDENPVGFVGVDQVVGDDGAGNGRSGCGPTAALNVNGDPVGGEDFEGGDPGGFGEGVGVDAEKERAGNPAALAVFAGCLGDGEDMVFVEAGIGGGAPVAGGAEADALDLVGGIGMERVVVRDDARDIWDAFRRDRFASKRMSAHGCLSFREVMLNL